MNEEKNPAAILRDRNRKVNTLLALILPLFLLIICAAGFLVKDRTYSSGENRTLQQLPSPNVQQILDGNTQEALERYLSDQLIGRDSWLSVKTAISGIFGGKESAGIYEGSGGYLIKRFREPDMKLRAAQQKAIQDLAEANSDLDVYMAVVPTAAEILESRLPQGAPNADQTAYRESWKEGLGDSVHYVDVSKILRNHRDEGIYYKTDSTWTSLGAYYAYKELAANMGLDLGDDSYEAIPVSERFRGNLAATSGRGGSTSDTITVYFYIDSTFRQIVEYVEEQEKSASLYSSEALETSRQLDVFLQGDHPLVRINSTSASTERLLIIKDEYANALVPFLVPGYREIVLVDPRYYYGDLQELIRDENITDILILYNADSLSTDTSLVPVLEDANE